MLILSKVCAEFHDRDGTVLFSIHPADRMTFMEAPESIRQDPLFEMLLAEGTLQMPPDKEALKKLENDPDAKPEKTGEEPTTASGGNLVGSEVSRNKQAPLRGAAPIEAAEERSTSAASADAKTSGRKSAENKG